MYMADQSHENQGKAYPNHQDQLQIYNLHSFCSNCHDRRDRRDLTEKFLHLMIRHYHVGDHHCHCPSFGRKCRLECWKSVGMQLWIRSEELQRSWRGAAGRRRTRIILGAIPIQYRRCENGPHHCLNDFNNRFAAVRRISVFRILESFL